MDVNSYPPVHLYAVLALAATLASIVAGQMREPETAMTPRGTFWLAFVTCGLLLAAWGHPIFVLALLAWQMQDVEALHLLTHMVVIAVMLPVVCVTVVHAWERAVKRSVQL